MLFRLFFVWVRCVFGLNWRIGADELESSKNDFIPLGKTFFNDDDFANCQPFFNAVGNGFTVFYEVNAFAALNVKKRSRWDDNSIFACMD
ncbi:hypothetical protein LWC08_15460 (plasmid) [Desulfobaculum bizertense]|uniref:hypothetical protein n=1 Tax=Desulfobaculum bizertense TaxID=376490 RepID=UPI001F48CC0A|nr:hypothetical protein [Desulfobaculum bizertense]UIJ39535.1 hypothetical protein LWC08_15460 [Desulfobaculum bizertense]